MKLKLILLTISLFALAFAARAQDKPAAQLTPETNKPEAKNDRKYTAQDYENLLAKLKGGDTNIDYTALRMAFVETKNYSFGGADKDEQAKFSKPFGDKSYKNALKEAEKFLETDYVDPDAHFVAYNSAKELNDGQKADFHKTVLLGLLNSIKNGNDGLSAQTPFKVITIGEEYSMMRFLGYKFSSQSLQNKDGHTFDVFEATDAKSGAKVTLYFNIDVVWKAENEIFGK